MAQTKLEREFQPILIDALKDLFPGCFIMKLDANQVQGIPDLLVLFEDKWAILETKRGTSSARQPNQEYYVEKFGQMSFSAFVDPTNMDEVLDAIQQAFFGSHR